MQEATLRACFERTEVLLESMIEQLLEGEAPADEWMRERMKLIDQIRKLTPTESEWEEARDVVDSVLELETRLSRLTQSLRDQKGQELEQFNRKKQGASRYAMS
jgi:hypothetical protein